VLRYYQDMTEEQAAEVLGCPKGTVKSRTHNALARLAELTRTESAGGK
jgi:DNA-directed RNA polymerase specialized sigma24 family protein